jgi:succinate dehydrogenase / fumarate reductase iron-sulfur subunit
MEPTPQTEPTVRLRIRRQDRPDAPSRWEEFDIPRRPNANIISCLQYIAAHPVTIEGKETTPVAYESNCLEEVCGACTMLVNGKVRQACSALVDHLQPTYQRQRTSQDNPVYSPVDYGNPPPLHVHQRRSAEEPIVLEPMTKFPVIRDLAVDRSRLFNDLKRVKAWVPIDGTYDLGPGPETSRQVAEERYPLSRCITCGCCLEACPQYTPVNHFVGAMVFTQVNLFNMHPTGAAAKDDRLDVMMEEGGIGDCSKAGNCVVVCPKEIPNLESIAAVGRQTAVHAVKKFFGGKSSRH